MYELSFWIEDFKEDIRHFKTLEEAMREFENWVEGHAEDLREHANSPVATIKIQKMEDVISVDI